MEIKADLVRFLVNHNIGRGNVAFEIAVFKRQNSGLVSVPWAGYVVRKR